MPTARSRSRRSDIATRSELRNASLVPPRIVPEPHVAHHPAGKGLVLDAGHSFLRRELRDSSNRHRLPVDVEYQLTHDLGTNTLQALVVEINLARHADILSTDLKIGYQDFLRILGTPRYQAYFARKYPALRTYVHSRVKGTLGELDDIRASLLSDEVALRNKGLLASTQIKNVRFTGDPHKGGLRTALIQFDDGGRILYKPRASAMDAFYAELAAKLEVHLDIPLYTPHYLASRNCLWQEYIEGHRFTRGNISDLDLSTLGAWLAIGQYTGLLDLHHENIIFSPDHGAVPVDFECGISPTLAPISEASARAMDIEALVTSVGIVPAPSVLDSTGNGIPDMSVMGYRRGADSAPGLALVDDLTSKVRMADTHTSASPQGSGPAESSGVETDIIPLDPRRIQAVIDGFRAGCRAIRDEAPWIIDTAEGKYAGSTTRVLLRSTSFYARALKSASHPRFTLGMNIHAERLQDLLAGHPRTRSEELIDLEIDSLQNGDVPYFVSSLGQDDVHWISPKGKHVKIDDCRVISGLDRLRMRIKRLEDHGDTTRQVRLLEQSLFSLSGMLSSGESSAPEHCLPSNLSEVLREGAVHILNNAWWLAESAEWPGLRMANGGEWFLSPGTKDLYSGSAGILLTLAGIQSLTGNRLEGLRSLMDGFVDHVRITIAKSLCDGPGVYFGFLGQLYAAACLERYGQVALEDGLFDEAIRGLRLPPSAEDSFDILSGAAGVLVMIERFLDAGLASRETCLPVAEECLSRLSSASIDLPMGGLAWPDERAGWLGGYSHGCAGIAMGAASGWRLTRSDSALKLVRGALRAQDSLAFDEGFGWVDRKGPSQGPEEVMNAWCHGFDGVLLASLGVGKLGGVSAITESSLVEQWAFSAPPNDASLCHGRAGRLSMLVRLRRDGPKPSLLYPSIDHLRMDHNISGLRRAVSNDVFNCCQPRDSRPKPTRTGLDDGLMMGLAGSLQALLESEYGSRAASPLCLWFPSGRLRG